MSGANTELGNVVFSETKRQILARDRHCVYCRRRLRRKHATLDHLIPVSRGGKHTLDNLAGACNTCNGQKEAMLPLEFVLWRIKEGM